MKRLGLLLTLLLGLGWLASPAGAQFEDGGVYGSDEGWFNQGWIGEDEGLYEESEYGYESDDYGYYDRGYDWETDDNGYDSWYGESDDWW